MKLLFLVPFSHSFMAYPIQKWKKSLEAHDLDFTISGSWPRHISMFDAVFLTSAFCAVQHNRGQEFVGSARNSSIEYARASIEHIRNAKAKIIFFDARDGIPSNFFSILPLVDVFLKRQVLKDRELYLTQAQAHYSPDWTHESPRREFPCARKDYLNRILVGWNIGLEAFGPLRKLEKVLAWNGITLRQHATPVESRRPYLTSFRGSFGGSRARHRNAAMAQLKALNRKDVRLGRPVNRFRYLFEMKRSKAIVSPFGFGEPCFRDYEAFMSGAALIKPDVSHLEVYPDVYHEGRTYLPVQWDFSDLPSALERIDGEEELRKNMAVLGQKNYLRNFSDPAPFISHLFAILERAGCANSQGTS